MAGDNTASIKKRISLPKDIGSHAFTDMEWWYCYALLNGDSGEKYAVMSAFYQAGELPILKGHYLIFSLIDLTEFAFQSFSLLDEKLAKNIMLINIPIHLLQCPHDESTLKLYKSLLKGKLPPPHQWLPDSFIEKDPIRLSYGSSSMTFDKNLEGQFKVTVAADGIEARLKFDSKKPVSLIGGDGKPDKLYYYSFPRNKVKGYIKKGESTEWVTGEGWFDHQWGYLGDLITKTGWDWFGLQLDDGRELLINEFRSIKTGETSAPMANIIESDGTLKFTRNLILERSNYWQSPNTNASYPLSWTITIPDFKLVLNVTAVFHEQEMPVLAPLNAIWEGVCSVSGNEINSNLEKIPISGKGFLELVGYANYKC